MSKLYYRVVYAWAGVQSGRSSLPFAVFADANREAMRIAGIGKHAKVYVFGRDPFAGDLVAEYACGNGRAICIPVVPA